MWLAPFPALQDHQLDNTGKLDARAVRTFFDEQQEQPLDLAFRGKFSKLLLIVEKPRNGRPGRVVVHRLRDVYSGKELQIADLVHDRGGRRPLLRFLL